MQRLSSWALPIILGVAGVALIIIGTLDLDAGPTASSPPFPSTTPSPIAEATPTPTPEPSAPATPSASVEPTVQPTPSPLPSDVVAVQIGVPSVGINVAVKQSTSDETDHFPPDDAAYILQAAHQPGRNTNSYIFGHALNSLFKPLWNVQLGDDVLVRMSDESILRYVVTEVRPNVACPDPGADPALNPEAFGVEPPLALQIHDTCEEARFWTTSTDYERLTLQTSQGYNRNWGELVIVADPDRS